MSERNLSHQSSRNSLEAIKKKIISRKDLPYASVEQQLGILDHISQSQLGRFLIDKGGLNGYWTQYIVAHPDNPRRVENPVEQFLLEQAPTALATQQRFLIFKEEIRKRLREGVRMASIPCGLMAEFLDLEFPIEEFTLVGVDIDEESLALAREYARGKKIGSHCDFIQRDAWDLQVEGEWDLIASNGLSVYESCDDKVVDLYREFFKALRRGGTLVTSVLTPPEDWEVSHVNQTHALMQKLILVDILDCQWQALRSFERAEQQLKAAGFETVEVKRDRASIFPTFIATKSN